MTWLAVLIVGVGAIVGLVKLWLILRFLRHVYDKGGADELTAAASAVSVVRWSRRHRTGLREPGTGQRDVSDAAASSS